MQWLTETEWSAVRLSFQVGVCAVLATLPVAIATGYLLARKKFFGKWLLEVAVDLPLVMPPVVTGYLLLLACGPRGPIGGWLERWFDARIVFNWWGAAIASAVVGFPLMVRAIRLAFQSVDPRLELAARTLGASRWDTFVSISLPLARSGILAGCVFAFARSLGEFGATIMVASNIEGKTQTIPLAIYSLANQPDGMEQTWRLLLVSVLLAAGALMLSSFLMGRQTCHESA